MLRKITPKQHLTGLGRMPNPLTNHDLLRVVLEQFGFPDAQFSALENTQNTNHCITAFTGEKFLLRQHQVSERNLAMLESELIWLEFLDTRGLTVQQPQKTLSGERILLLEGQRFSMLSWLDGEVHETLSTVQAESAGELMALLHLAAREFVSPIGFERPSYDQAFLQRTLAQLEQIYWLNQDIPLFKNALEFSQSVFEEKPTWGLIHADLHPANMIIQGSRVLAIDFENCGFGPLGYDIAMTLGYLEPQEAFLEAYQRVLPLPNQFALERSRFSLVEWLSNVAFLAPREIEREGLEADFLPFLRRKIPELLR